MSEEKENKEFNPAKEFNDRYSNEIQEILHVPLIAKCKEKNEMVPYEYSNRCMRYQRSEKEVDSVLAKKAKALVFYCLRNKIPKKLISNFRGGNLWSLDNNMKSYLKQ